MGLNLGSCETKKEAAGNVRAAVEFGNERSRSRPTTQPINRVAHHRSRVVAVPVRLELRPGLLARQQWLLTRLGKDCVRAACARSSILPAIEGLAAMVH